MFENLISLDNKKELETYLHSLDYKTSGLSFSSLFLWKNINDFKYEKVDDYLLIRGVDNLEGRENEVFLFPPLVKSIDDYSNKKKLRELIIKLDNFCKKNDKKLVFELVPIHLINYFLDALNKNEINVIVDRDNFDYVYLREDLISLKGKALHSKKNHLNYFERNFNDYVFKTITKSSKNEISIFLKEFNERKTKNVSLSPHEIKLLKMEEEAILEIIDNLDKYNYYTGAIYIKEKLIAICIAGRLSKNTITIHVEKADINYRGAYQKICKCFCESLCKDIKYINREEDMGILGLRKAKLSLKPFKMIEKYKVIINL